MIVPTIIRKPGKFFKFFSSKLEEVYVEGALSRVSLLEGKHEKEKFIDVSEQER